MSTRTVDRYVEAFDKPIKQACEKGQSMIRASNVITARADYVKFSGTLGPYDRLKVTDIQQAVIDSFVKYGFAAKMEVYGDTYVPRDLADDDGNGPEHRNYSLTVRW